ncbi:MAG: 30S ribosomal protein S9 [candidate division Zixibacteria bacterium]|nr:30S ribosomal protein S9 [candidate division Zixibacteria bacterium]MDH4035630.1 30S ribosomal protein S9 [candidate division Zixibacteria bacterium]
MGQDNFSATGRRKEAVARAVLKPGKGIFTVNGKDVVDHLCRETLVAHAKEALLVTEHQNSFDIRCTARGGGIRGQAGAIRLAVARALLVMDESNRVVLRKHGLLTRDPREVERKKYGQPKARKRFQFSKR